MFDCIRYCEISNTTFIQTEDMLESGWWYELKWTKPDYLGYLEGRLLLSCSGYAMDSDHKSF